MPNMETRATAGERKKALGPEAEPQRGSQHDQLSVFAGSWQAEGLAFNGDVEDRMISDQTWEWLPGGFFLTCRFESRAGDTEHRGFGYLGYDAERGGHTCRMIDNLGYERRYDLSVNGQVWTFRGDRERATYVFSQDGRGVDIRWEQSTNGVDFTPLCELKATRTAGLGPTTH